MIYTILPLLSAVVPSIVILLLFYYQDKYPEPFPIIIRTFFLGVLICIPAYFINTYFINLIYESYYDYEITINTTEFLNALIPGALVEEILKFIVLYHVCFKYECLDEKIDALVYGTSIALGFAASENLVYVLNASDYDTTWSTIAWLRAFTAVPAHACWGIIMGYFLYTFKNNKVKSISLGLSVPIFLHMLYNSNYISYSIVLIISIFMAVSFTSKSKRLQRIVIWK